jgi:hypothetical protein
VICAVQPAAVALSNWWNDAVTERSVARSLFTAAADSLLLAAVLNATCVAPSVATGSPLHAPSNAIADINSLECLMMSSRAMGS